MSIQVEEGENRPLKRKACLALLFAIAMAVPGLASSQSFKGENLRQLNGFEVINFINGKMASDVSRSVAVRINFRQGRTYIYRSAGGVMPIEKTGSYIVKRSGEGCLLHAGKPFRCFHIFKNKKGGLFWRFGADQSISPISNR